MKYFIDGVVVVEGKNDVSYLSSFIDAIFVTTNGYEIPREEVDFLNQIKEIKKVLILTDSDEAGKTIRNHLFQQIPEAINVEVDLAKCNKNNKHGVAECEQKEVISALKTHFSAPISYNYVKLSDLGPINKPEREFICRKLHLGVCNQKTMIKRMAILNLSISDIENARKMYHGN